LASGRPLIVILEDLHWADEMTIRLLSFVSRRISTHPVLVVGTLRDEELAEAPALRRLVEELERDGQRVRLNLAPLTRTQTASLAGALARTSHDEARMAELGERVWARSEGNPFVIVETTRLLEEQRLPHDAKDVPLPSRVREVITARVDRLTP